MKVLRGKSVDDKIAFGKLVFYKRTAVQADVEVAEDCEAELCRLERALEDAEQRLKDLYEQWRGSVGEAEAAVFEMQGLLLHDESFAEKVRLVIREQAVSAPYAVEMVGEEIIKRLEAVEDEYIRQRADDMRDVVELVAELLRAEEGCLGDVLSFRGASSFVDKWQPRKETYPSVPFILMAENLLPGEMVSLVGSKVQGIVLTKGSTGSHVAILARSMGVPMLAGVGVLEEKLEGKMGILDGEAGVLYVEPQEAVLAQLSGKRNQMALEAEGLLDLRGKENCTLDGRSIKVYANVGSLADVEQALYNDAGGIGLLRSECLYMERSEAPDEEMQFTFYKQVLERMGDKEVVIRTFDIGGDKRVPYLELGEEENPALGFKGIRLGLVRPELLKTQLRALYRAGCYGKLRIMYPMITSVEELKLLKEQERQAKEELADRGERFDGDVPRGIMIETPAAAILSEELAGEVDFFSVGTNDLTQYTLALDRQNASLTRFRDEEHRAVLKFIEMAAENAHRAGIWIGICGELAADRNLTERLLQLGIDELSVSPGEILRLRERIRTLGV